LCDKRLRINSLRHKTHLQKFEQNLGFFMLNLSNIVKLRICEVLSDKCKVDAIFISANYVLK
jgi:hypothetical protein